MLRVESWKMRIATFAFLVAAMNAALAQGQCYVDPFTGQKICGPGAGPFDVLQSPVLNPQISTLDSSPHCRITLGDGTAGSGTLVARSESGGLVLTCSHLFDGSTANIEVAFPSGQRFAAHLVERDRAHDLAALVIRRPDVEPVEVSGETSLTRIDETPLTACGFGPNGQFRCVRGQITGQATPVGAAYPSLTIRGAVRPGDSGGGVLNAEGKLVGVVWGQRDGLTYASCGRPLRAMLDRILGTGQGAGSHIAAGAEKPSANSEAKSPAATPSPAIDMQAWSSEIEARIRALDAAKQDKGEYLRRGDVPDLSPYAKRDELEGGLQSVSGRFESILGRVQGVHERIEQVAEERSGILHGLSMGKLLVGALGLSGPLAAAVMVAGGVFASRRRKRTDLLRENAAVTHPIAVDTPPPPQRTVPETHYVSYEIDSFARAHQWASEQIARKYPGAAEILQAQDSLIKQHVAGR